MQNKNSLLTLVKIVLTLPVAYALVYPFLHSSQSVGILQEIETLGTFGSIALASVFLIFVFFYCRDLSRTLSLISPNARVAEPRSVWLMFLIPYNFIEDFFIIANVAASLRKEAAQNPALQSLTHFGLASGIGWCAAQIVSLWPSEIGSFASLIAIALWIVHWRFIRYVNRLLANS